MTLIRHILPLWLSLLVALTAQAAVVDLATNSNFSLTNAIEVWVR